MSNQFKAFIFNGDKKARIDDMPLEAWSNVAGGSSEGASSWASTAWQFRALTVIAEQVANLPYSIKDKESGDVVYDTDNDRGNFPAGMEWLTEFNELLHKTAISCKQEGAAYWLAVGLSKGNDYPGGKVLQLRWLAKKSIQPEFDKMAGLVGFTRFVGSETKSPKDWQWQDVIYFWPPDPDVEIGPAMNYPGKSVKEEVNALWSLVHMFTKYFDRGLVAPFVLTYENTPTQEEQQSIKSYFTSLTTGLKNAFKLAMFRQDVKVQTLGDGLKQLPTGELESGRRLALMAGYGVPETKFVQSAANRATRELDERAFITDTIWPFADWLENQLNKQLFYKIGKVLNFHVERLDAMQTEELQGADSFAKLVAAGIHPDTAAAMLGMEIPQGYTLTGGKDGNEAEEESEAEEPENDAEESDEADPSDELVQEEMATLRRWVTKRVKRGEVMTNFNAVYIPQDTVKATIKEANTNIFVEKSIKTRIKLENKYTPLIAENLEYAAKTLVKTVGDADKLEERLTVAFEPLRLTLRNMLLESAAAGVNDGRAWVESEVMGVTKEFGVDWDTANQAAIDWLLGDDSFLETLLEELGQSTINQIKQTIAEWIENKETILELAQTLANNYGFSSSRAETIAVTEVTRAYARGNIESWRASGLVQSMQWRTANDERVCPICAPLGGLEFGEKQTIPGNIDQQLDSGVTTPLGTAFTHPGGNNAAASYAGQSYDSPPAHPRCRCSIAPIIG